MVTVYLGTFDKKINSTARPDTSTMSQYNCDIKADTSMTAPTLIITTNKLAENHAGGGWNDPAIANINYCYIPLWRRYYFINDIRFGAPNTEISCTIDVLATYKTNIGSSTQYVLRSASSWDGTISDTLYPTTAVITRTRRKIDFTFSTDDDSGMYVVGVVGSGVTQYYLMRSDTANVFLKYIMSNEYAEDSLGSFGVALLGNEKAKFLVDPLQYITSLMWLPFNPNLSVQSATNTIKVGNVDVVFAGTPFYNIIQPIQSLMFNFALDGDNAISHPQAVRGEYLNLSPYTEIQVSMPSFGVFSIDPLAIKGYDTLSCIVNIDLRLGTSTMYVGGIDTSHIVREITTMSTQLGVNIQLSQVLTRGFGLLDAITSAAGVATAAATGRGVGAVTAFASTIGDIISNSVPMPQKIGSTGGADGFGGYPAILITYHHVVNNDLANNGAPLCQNVTISTLSGYIQCDHTHITLTGATAQEKQQVINYMNGGFYYE